MDKEKLLQEIKFRTSRSSGPGGQNINKVETRVELIFSLANTNALTPEEKALATKRLSNKLTKEGTLIIASQKSRSQLANKENAIHIFLLLMEEAIRPPQKRKKRKPSQAAKEKRLREKKMQSEKKALRKKTST
ncbi:MAG TPA: aminoacyl-tRNA hydrolase [Bacteroidetes bacterium]|nr:aminoacyl-tRNA hydrolase [Bacteroidota bacterium]